MKRRILRVLFALALVVLGGLAIRAVWVVGSAGGARWLLAAVSSPDGIQVTARDVQGRLFGHLTLRGVHLKTAHLDVDVDRLDLRLNRAPLLAGRVVIPYAHLEGVRILDHSPRSATPPDLTWPKITGLPARIAVRVASLQVIGLSYRRLDDPPQTVASLATSATWRHGALALEALAVHAAAGDLAGTLRVGFGPPGLEAQLALGLPQPLAGLDRFYVRIRCAPGAVGEQLAGQLELTGAAGLGQAPALAGTLTFQGTAAHYQGQLALTHAGNAWRSANLAGGFQGDPTGVRLGPLTGSALDGSLAGQGDLSWRDGLAASVQLQARNLNPARVAPDWIGNVNLDLAGSYQQPALGPLQAEVKAALLDSRLHGQPLTGNLQGRVAGASVRLEALNLRGRGFALKAGGQLDQKIAFGATVSDLSRLLPGAAGSLQGQGWVRWRDERLAGSLDANAHNLAAGGLRIGSGAIAAHLLDAAGSPLDLTAQLHQVVLGPVRADAATLALAGTALDHTLLGTLGSEGTQGRIALAGSYVGGGWKGTLQQASVRGAQGAWDLQTPARLAFGPARLSLSDFGLRGPGPARIDLAADLTLKPLGGWATAQWAGLNLALANPWLAQAKLTGATQGRLRLELPAGNRLVLAAKASAAGTAAWRGQTLTVTASDLDLQAGEAGLNGGVSVHLADGGELTARLASTAPARLAMPQQGSVNAHWQNLDLAQAQPWLPAGVRLKGRLQGQLTGTLGPGQSLRLDGETHLLQGDARWQGPEGEIGSEIRQAAVSWTWQGASLKARAAVELAAQGQVQGSVQLPLAARFPLVLDPQGSFQGTVAGKVQEQGLLTALFPSLIQESHGTLEATATADGTWAAPRLRGQARLADAGASLPEAGIRIKDLECSATLDQDLIRIDRWRAVSGPGHLEGTAEIRLKGWQVASYRATLGGDRFEAVHLPELQVLASPQLTFEGSPDLLKVRGELLIPELELLGLQKGAALGPSPDVVRVGAAPPPPGPAPLALDLQVRVRVGDKVFVRLEGLDVQLGGSLELAGPSLEVLTSQGQIQVVQGRFKAYGVDLQIIHGWVFYAGGGLDQPVLDILALRTIQDVKAGVKVTGSLQAPVTRLYSEPAMPDVDVLAYIVLGHPIASGEQASLVNRTAGMLLGTKQVAGLQEQLKHRLGLSTLELQNNTQASGTMGYKHLTPTGAADPAAAAAPTLASALVTVGKYLTPKLYVSFGRSLAGDSSLFKLRYDLAKHWQLESQSGQVTGVDAYYKIEFK